MPPSDEDGADGCAPHGNITLKQTELSRLTITKIQEGLQQNVFTSEDLVQVCLE